jgi:outer membrane protein
MSILSQMIQLHWRSWLSRFGMVAGIFAGTFMQAAPPIPATLDLETSIRYAIENNYAIRQARERIREQEGLIVEVGGQARPNVSLNSLYSLDADSLTPSGNSDKFWQIGLEVSQLLYSGGGVQAALSAQGLVRESALLDLQTVINDQLLQVRINFYDVLFAREQIGVAEENVALLKEQLTTARNRFEAGAVSNFDVLRAEVELANAQPPLIRARNTLRNAIDQLRFSLGFDSRDPAELSRVPNFAGDLSIHPMAIDLATAIDRARANRPELLRLATIAKAQEAGVTIAKSGLKPTVSVSGGYELRKANSSERFGSSLDGWTLGLRSSWAIFDGKSTRGRINQALSQKEQAELALAEATLGIEVEVRRALSSLSEATELVEAAKKVVEQALEALRLANARYGAGTATQLELLAVQVALTQARNNELEASYSYNVSAASVRRSMGMGDVFFEE